MRDPVIWWNVVIYGAAMVTFWRLGSALTDLATALREPREHNIKLPPIINVEHRSEAPDGE